MFPPGMDWGDYGRECGAGESAQLTLLSARLGVNGNMGCAFHQSTRGQTELKPEPILPLLPSVDTLPRASLHLALPGPLPAHFGSQVAEGPCAEAGLGSDLGWNPGPGSARPPAGQGLPTGDLGP